MKEPALGIVELKSVARGLFAADAIIKKAPVKILSANPTCPGKYVIVFAGEVANVQEALNAGIAAGDDLVINHLFLPNIHLDIISAMTATTNVEKFGAIGIIETFSVASCVVAADLAAKATAVKLIEIRLANGLGGKGYFTFTGELTDVMASIDVAKEHIKAEGLLAGCEIIANPHPDLIDQGIYCSG